MTTEAASSASKAHANFQNQLLLQTDPLHRACKAGNWQETKQLIEACGSTRQARCRYVNRRDANGSSPIFHCVWYGYYRVLALLIYHGANPNLQNNRRNTALHLVAEQMHWSCAGLLLQAGARIDIANYEGKTCMNCIPPAADRPEAPEFERYMIHQTALYAREYALKTELFFAAPVPTPMTSKERHQSSHSHSNSTSQPLQGSINDYEGVRRLCWSVAHLEKNSATNPSAQALAKPSSSATSPPSVSAVSSPVLRPTNANLVAAASQGDFYRGRPGAYAEDPMHASLDPDLLAPIQAIEWNGMQQQMQNSSALHSPTVLHTQPHHLHVPSTASAASSISASSVGGLSFDTKHKLKSALYSLQQLSLQYPSSNLGPGLESRREPPSDAKVNPWDAASATMQQQGPALSFHGLSHLLNHLSTHWIGMPLAYKKFLLSYLIRFASNASNAACMMSATRPIVDGWVNDHGTEQPILMRLVDSVLDWLELHRGVSSQETDCSLLPPSRTFHAIVAGLRMQPAAGPSVHPINSGPTNTSGSATATAQANSGSTSAAKTSVQPTPKKTTQAASSPTTSAATPSYGAAFNALPMPLGAMSVHAPVRQSSGASSSRPPLTPNFGPMSPSQQPGTTASGGSNPFIPSSTYMDDYEVASLVLELVASILSTLRLHQASITPEMIVGGKNPAEEAIRVLVDQEELALSGQVKIYTSGGGGGYGSLATAIHPSVSQYGSTAKEGVHDAATDQSFQDHEKSVEQKVARRATVRSQSAFSPRTMDNPGNLVPGSDSTRGNTARAMIVDRAHVRLWRNVVRLFEHGAQSSICKLLAICIRAPFPPNVHPLISLRVMYLLKEGFMSQKVWNPSVMECFRTEEIVTYSLHCLKNAQYLLRPPKAIEKKLRGKDFWKRAFEATTNNPIPIMPTNIYSALMRDPSTQSGSGASHAFPGGIVIELETTSVHEKRFQDIVMQASSVHQSTQNSSRSRRMSQDGGAKDQATAASSINSSNLKPLHLSPVQAEPAIVGPDTQRELDQLLAQNKSLTPKNGPPPPVGATALFIKLTKDGAKSDDGNTPHTEESKSTTRRPQPLHTEALAEPLSNTQVPYSPKFTLRSSTSVTALELQAPVMQTGTGADYEQTKSHKVLARLRSPTAASRMKLKLSTKELVMEQLAKEHHEKHAAEEKLRLEEANTVQKIADPMKFGGQSLFARASALGIQPLALPSGNTPRSPNPLASPNTQMLMTPGASAQVSAASSALPDFFGAATIGHRMMLVDRCMDFLLGIILDSARRAQEIESRKLAASKQRAIDAAEEKRKQAEEEQRRGLDPGTLALRNKPARLPDPIEVRHESTGHRTLRGLNDLYGPPPLTTLCSSLMNWGILDSILLLLSPANQSLTCHRHLNLSGSEDTNTEGIVMVTPENENIGVYQAVQSLCYLLRMDACIDLIYMSPHALCMYSLLSTTSDEHVANSILYIFSHLLRKRRWNARLLALKGRNPNTYLTEAEKEQEESQVQREAEQKVRDDAMRAEAIARGEEDPIGSVANDSSIPPPSAHIPLEYLLMKWARIAVHLSLSCLPLKPWSTLPKSVLLRNIPARPSEIPMKMLVYQPLSAEEQADMDRNRIAEDMAQRVQEQAKRLRRLQAEREEQRAMDRLFMTAISGKDGEDQPTADDEFASIDPLAASMAMITSNPLAREQALSSSSIPPEQSWFALHYSPPTAAQKTYVLNLEKHQRRKLEKRLTLLEQQLNAIQPNSARGEEEKGTLHIGGLTLSKLSLKDAQVNAALAASGLAPPFTPISALGGSKTGQSDAARLYRQSLASRMGGSVPPLPGFDLSDTNYQPDANILVVEQFLQHISTPVAQARTLQQVSRRSTGRAGSPTLAEITHDAMVDRVLSPTTRSLQARLTGSSSPRVGSVIESPRDLSARARRHIPLSELAAVDESKPKEKATIGARTNTSHRTHFSFGIEEGSKIQKRIEEMQIDRDSARDTARSHTLDDESTGENESHASSDDSTSSDDDATSGSIIYRDPKERADRRATRRAAKEEKAKQMAKTEEARQRIRANAAAAAHAQRSGSHVVSSSTPRRIGRGYLPTLKTAGAMTNASDADRPPPSNAIQSKLKDEQVIGGITQMPSFANIAMAESILYRLLHCLLGFTRYESDATRLVECGGVDFIAGLINHPVFDISLHALKILTILTTRFSEDFLVQMMEALVRQHISNCWMGISIGRTDTGAEAGFPWCTLDSVVSSCADFLRVDASFQPKPSVFEPLRRYDQHTSNLPGVPQELPPVRDERSALAFQLLVNLCQDPKGRGYAAVKKQSIWYENLLHDVLSHPSLKDLEDRQKRFQKVAHTMVQTDGFPFQVEKDSTSTIGIHAVSLREIAQSSNSPSRKNSIHHVKSPSHLLSPHLHLRTPSSRISNSPVSTPKQSRPSSAGLRSSGAPSPSNSMRPNPNVKVRRPSAIASETFVSGGKSTTGTDANMRKSSVPNSKLSVIPVSPFGGHWLTSGGMPYDRYFPGGSGLPVYATSDGTGHKLPTAEGLDWEIPGAAAPGSTELNDLVAESQLTTQSVGLRVCQLRSCGAVEHTVGTFVLCPRCLAVAYCCVGHRTLAYKSWHDRVCSVTKKQTIKPNQKLRYPVKQQQRLHSSLPARIRQAILASESEEVY